MRSDFLLALLICGTVVVAIPPLSDQMLNRDVVELLSKPDVTDVTLTRMSPEYRFGCYVLGAGMIVTSVFAAAVSGRRAGGRSRATAATGDDRPEPAAGWTGVRETSPV